MADTDPNSEMLKEVRCALCNETRDGVIIFTKDLATKQLICSNCLSKIKTVA